MSQNETMILALQITAIGMGLVFAAILLLWLMMALLVRVAGQDAPEEEPQEEAESVDAARFAQADTQAARKRLAAAAAVAVALARQCESSEPHEFPLPPTAIVSAWQAIMRTRMLSKRGPTR